MTTPNPLLEEENDSSQTLVSDRQFAAFCVGCFVVFVIGWNVWTVWDRVQDQLVIADETPQEQYERIATEVAATCAGCTFTFEENEGVEDNGDHE